MEKAGIRDGRYGFKIKLPDSLIDQKEHVVRVVVKDNLKDLPNSPKTILLKSKYEYTVEGIKGNFIVGKIKKYFKSC